MTYGLNIKYVSRDLPYRGRHTVHSQFCLWTVLAMPLMSREKERDKECERAD